MNRFIQDIKPDQHYSGVGNSHNIVANEETETIFVVGATEGDIQHCDGECVNCSFPELWPCRHLTS